MVHINQTGMISLMISHLISFVEALLELDSHHAYVARHVEPRRTLDAASTYCHCIERLLFESSDTGMQHFFASVYFSLFSFTCFTFLSFQEEMIV